MELCDVIPYHPYSNWDCAWSDSMKTKICQKSCVENFKLSSGSTQLKCHVKNGWLEKQMAKCELKLNQSCETDDISNYNRQLSLELLTCSK